MSRFVALALVFTAACASSQKSSDVAVKSQSAPEVRSDQDSNLATCVAMFERQRACTDQYIPALVDLSISRNRYGKVTETREELIAQALKEWEVDSTDSAIDATCRSALDVEDPNFVEQQVPVIKGCLANSECQPYVDCIIAATATWWDHRAAQKQKE